MEKTQMTNQNQENTDSTSPVMPRKVVRISELLGDGPQEAFVLDVAGNEDNPLDLENIIWICGYTELDTSNDVDRLVLQNVHSATTDSKVEVDTVQLFTERGADSMSYDKLMMVGMANGQYYKKWSDSGKFPYSKYCTANNPGKLRPNVIYGSEYGDTLLLFMYIHDPESQSIPGFVNLYKNSDNQIPIAGENGLPINVNGLPFVRKKACSAFNVSEPIYRFPPMWNYSDTDIIVDINLLVDESVGFGINSRVILDGGNLYRWYSMASLSPMVICKNGNIICRNSQFLKDLTLGYPRSGIFRNLSAGAVTGPHMAQCVFSYEFNVLDFIDTTKDYSAIASSTSINATNVLKRIFDAVYEYGEQNGNRFVIRFPENQYGNASYHLTEPLVIPHGVTIDFGGARLLVGVNGSNMPVGDATCFKPSDTKSIISFGHNPVLPILVNAQIRNVEIQLINITRDCVEKVIDLTYFSGILDNVRIDMGGATDIVALWQPYGTPWITYSDMKIIRRCIISNFGWRVDIPTVIFCLGDGCIIEQSILGFVAIIGGNGYTIRGCLNDKYMICDSSVDFTASYWEVGLFEILNSEVSFGCGRLHASNALRGTADQNKYLGPWFAIDTKDSYTRLRKIINDQNLNTDNYKEQVGDENQTAPSEGTVFGRIYERASTVEFKPTMKVQTTFWGYTQPWSEPLFKVEGHPRIIGLENIASVNELYFSVPGSNTNYIWPHSTCAASIPLVNGDFHDWRTSVKVPENVTIEGRVEPNVWLSNGPKTDIMIRRAGLEWSGEGSFTEFKVIFELDRKRQLYSRIYECDEELKPAKGCMPLINVNVTYTESEDAPHNLKTILLFKYDDEDCKRLYMARNHFKDVSYATFVNAGTRELEFLPGKIVNVGEFSFIKRIGLSSDVEVSDANGNYLIAGLDLTTPAIREYFNNHTTPVTCMSGQDVDMADCDGLCYGHACLCDNKGNLVPEVKDCVFMYHGVEYYNECTRMDIVGDKNVRAYVDEVPMTGEWTDGDEVVIDCQQAVYRYYGDTWHQII